MVNSDELVWSLNLVSGQVARIQRHVFEHPAFALNQIEVEPFTESYDPATWTPKTKKEYLVWAEVNEAIAHHDAAPELQIFEITADQAPSA